MSNPHTLFPNSVILRQDTHQYIGSDDKEYMSFSKLYNFLVPKFDSDFMAGKVAIKDGTTKSEVLKKWQYQTDEGTRIDEALTRYSQTGQILKSDSDLIHLIPAVLEKYKVYNKCYDQLVLYDKDFRVAGSPDKISICSNRKDSKFHLSDGKVFENGMTYLPKGQTWLNHPFSYLPNTRYTKINFQTSYYSFLFEKLTGRKCERIFVDVIRPQITSGKVTGYKNEVIPMPYLKHQIEVMLEHFKDKIINTLEPEQMPELEEF